MYASPQSHGNTMTRHRSIQQCGDVNNLVCVCMLQQANIPLSSDALDKLIRILDVNKDGEVDFTYVATLTSELLFFYMNDNGF